MNDFLKKLIERKQSEIDELKKRSDESQDLAEVRAIGELLEKLANEIAEAKAQLEELDKEKEEQRKKRDQGKHKICHRAIIRAFPAYESTEISARDKEALDSAKATLESVRRQSLESELKALELEKAKLRNKFF